MYTGGDIEEVVFKHPTLGTIRCETKGNEAFTFDPGGLRSNDDDDAVTGAGEMIDSINRKRWSMEGPLVINFTDKTSLENIPNLAASPELSVVTVTMVFGKVFKGKGKPVGDIKVDTNNSQMSLKVAGGGKMLPIEN
ncbi:hypothetical protein [Muricauda sp. MAR_2010_75]|uniref:hypothetical protein n=1 Tax=Allomuricauda sp. MAR_2010_75 TaxID=1250232 RepID=UPI00055DC008|nr:hypothetical protein [Muricauda sp. MAR_2010_75]